MTFNFKNANENDTFAGSELGQRVFAEPIRLLEFNRPAHSPWLTVPLAEEEIVIQDANERTVFTAEGWDD